MGRYDDIIHHSRPVSSRSGMRREDRAKLFAPFAALSGHDEAVHARDKVLLPQACMTEHTREVLDQKLRQIRKGKTVTVVYFIARKRQGNQLLGEYLTVTDTVIRADPNERILYLRGQNILFEDLMDVRGEGIDGLEEDHGGWL